MLTRRSTSCLILLSALGVVAPWARAGQPHLVLSQPSWDFGEVWHPAPVQMTLVLKNDGDAMLNILEVHSSCGCTVVQPARNTVPPGETTDVRVTFESQGKQGHVTSKVIIRSDDPAKAEAEFPIQGFVKRAVTREPLGGLGIRSLTGKPGLTGVLKLENQTDKPMTLKLDSNTLAALDVEIREITPGLTYEVLGRTNRELPAGQYRGNLTFSTGLEREPKMSVGAAIRIMALVESSPPAIYLRKGDEKPIQRQIWIQYYGDKPDFEVTGARCDNPDITLKVEAASDPYPDLAKMQPPIRKMAKIMASLPAASKLPEKGSRIELTTNIPEVPRLDILVTNDKNAFEGVMYGTGGHRPENE